MEIIRHDDAVWEDLSLTLVLDRDVTPEWLHDLEELLGSWFQIGSFGGFDGLFHDMCPPSIAHDEELGTVVEWWVDFGDSDPIALDVLIRVLENYCVHNGVVPLKVVLGTIIH
jgi:hypothetical protein